MQKNMWPKEILFSSSGHDLILDLNQCNIRENIEQVNRILPVKLKFVGDFVLVVRDNGDNAVPKMMLVFSLSDHQLYDVTGDCYDTWS